MTPRGRSMMRRRGWRKLVTLVLIAAVAGTALGVGIAALSRQGDATELPATEPRAAAGSDSPSTTAAAPSAASPGALRVQVLGAILHPAGTESGQRRRRARVTVRVRVENRGPEVVTPARPALLVAGHRVQTDASADSPRTHLSEVASGETVGVTLRFETAGDVTTTLMQKRRARMLLAGRTLSFGVKIAPPITLSDAANADGGQSTDANGSDETGLSDRGSP